VDTGGLVLFDIIIENTSAVDSVTIDAVTGDAFGDITTRCPSSFPVSLEPDGSVQCSFQEEVSGDPATRKADTVVVVGTDDDGNEVSARGTAIVEIAGTVDLEVVIQAVSSQPSRRPRHLGDPVVLDATWEVTVGNGGPSEATGVVLHVTPPADTAHVSESCVLMEGSDGGTVTPCGFDASTGLAKLPSIPPGATLAMTLVTTVDAVEAVEAEVEVIGVRQRDVDSPPGDGRGDDFDRGEILMTLGLADSALPTGVAPPSDTFPIWLLGLLAVVVAAALARAGQLARWRLR
jgi:hypothetical protein